MAFKTDIHPILKGEACSFLHRVSETTLALRHGSISHIHTNLDSDQLSLELVQLDWHECKGGFRCYTCITCSMVCKNIQLAYS